MIRFALTDIFRSNKPRATGEESRARRSPAGRRNARRRALFIEHLEVRRVLSAFTVINTDDSGAGSLRQAIVDANVNQGGDIIQFAIGVAGTITLTSGELAITDAVDLQGPGAGVLTVSGNGASRVFEVTANSTISGLTITRGSAIGGGGIRNFSTLTVDSSTLSDNSAFYGGGIWNSGTLTLDSSTLSDNSAIEIGVRGGGGIYNEGSLTVESSTLRGNSAFNGGGIYNHGVLTVDGSTLSGNYSSVYGGGGGGISNFTTMTVTNSTLSGNSNPYQGGGIYNSGSLTVDSSILSDNTAGVFGGGIMNRGTLSVDRSTISGNSAQQGGGIENDSRASVHNSTLSGNSAAAGGGIINGGTLTVDSSTLSGNSAGVGGGIFNGGTLTVQNSILSSNRGDIEGGGITNRGGTLTVNNGTISGNSTSGEGGGIFVRSGTLTVDGSTLSGNSATSGGGIVNRGGMATVHNSTLRGNSAGYFGGGIVNNGTLIVDSSTISGNSAAYGGGIESSVALTLQNSTLTGNSATQYGGGIFNTNSGTLILESSTISGNSAEHGAGINNRGGTSTLENSIVAANFGVDIDGAVASGSSHNLIGVDTNLSGISHGSNGNQIGSAAAPINPMLGALQDNGGPTQTMALLLGSPAINTGDNSLIPPGVTTDQRGNGYARIDNGTVDIGAFERVVNQPPTSEAGGPYTIVRGGIVLLDGSGSSDPNQSNTTLTYVWDLDGDGVFGETGTAAIRGEETGMTPTFSAAGLNAAGTMTVSLRVTDDGGLSAVDTGTVTVVIAALQADPLNPGQTMLVVGGSTGDDTIRIRVEDDHHDGNDNDAQYVTVRINEHDEVRQKIRGNFALPVSRVVVYAQAGNDDVKMDDHSTIPAWLYGGDGNDRLKGGAGHDVLLGEADDDLVAGSAGRDLLIGGTGEDRIVGNSGDDILIAGTTDFGNHAVAFSLIMKEWTRTDAAFAIRVDHLKLGGGWNAGYLLTDNTVHDDHAEDVLTGSEGNDWFLFNRDGDGGVKDKATDLSAFELLYALDLDWLNSGI